MGGGGGGEGFRGGAVGAGEDIFPDDLQNITTTTPPQGSGEDAGVCRMGRGWGQPSGEGGGSMKVKSGSQDALSHGV